MKYEVGDKVRVVRRYANDEAWVKGGEVYTITDVEPEYGYYQIAKHDDTEHDTLKGDQLEPVTQGTTDPIPGQIMNKQPYEPYKFDALNQLLYKCYSQGNYGGRKTLFRLTMEGEFEGFSGRASETWEQRFMLEMDDLSQPAIARTIQDVCQKALTELTRLEDAQLNQDPIPDQIRGTVV